MKRDQKCVLEGCQGKRVAKMMCNRHYLRFWKYGDASVVKEKSAFKHGKCQSSEYKSWADMIQRCTNINNKSYPIYGGRGIAVCDEWRKDFSQFLTDMGRKPALGHSIDRIDVNGNYEPGNCRWASKAEQSANTRNTRHVVLNGEAMHLQEAARRLNRPPSYVARRIGHDGVTINPIPPMRKTTARFRNGD